MAQHHHNHTPEHLSHRHGMGGIWISRIAADGCTVMAGRHVEQDHRNRRYAIVRWDPTRYEWVSPCGQRTGDLAEVAEWVAHITAQGYFKRLEAERFATARAITYLASPEGKRVVARFCTQEEADLLNRALEAIR